MLLKLCHPKVLKNLKVSAFEIIYKILHELSLNIYANRLSLMGNVVNKLIDGY